MDEFAFNIRVMELCAEIEDWETWDKYYLLCFAMTESQRLSPWQY